MLSRAGSPCPPFGLEMPPSYPEPAGEPLEQSSQPPAEQQKAALQNHQERKQSPPHTPSRAPCAWGCAEGPGEPFNTQRPLSTGALGRKGRRVSTKRLVFGSAHGSDFALPLRYSQRGQVQRVSLLVPHARDASGSLRGELAPGARCCLRAGKASK